MMAGADSGGGVEDVGGVAENCRGHGEGSDGVDGVDRGHGVHLGVGDSSYQGNTSRDTI